MVENLDQDEWNGVYYDSQTGSFVTIDIENGHDDTVTLEYYDSDSSEDIDIENFDESDFYPIPDSVVQNPEDIILETLGKILEYSMDPDSVYIQFAMEFTEIVPTENQLG